MSRTCRFLQNFIFSGISPISGINQKHENYQTFFMLNSAENEKYNKQCLLDTPRRVTVNNKRLISTHKKSEKICIYKSHGIIKNYKGK